MIKIKANIKLYKTGRKTAFKSGYRPLFNFIETMKTSGEIRLIDRSDFFPEEEGIVEINFLNMVYLGDNFAVGKAFTFDEGLHTLGEGIITEIINT